MVESVAPCRPNVMSLKYILSSDPALTAAPTQNQATAQERKINASKLPVLVNRTGPEVPVHARKSLSNVHEVLY